MTGSEEARASHGPDDRTAYRSSRSQASRTTATNGAGPSTGSAGVRPSPSSSSGSAPTTAAAISSSARASASPPLHPRRRPAAARLPTGRRPTGSGVSPCPSRLGGGSVQQVACPCSTCPGTRSRSCSRATSARGAVPPAAAGGARRARHRRRGTSRPEPGEGTWGGGRSCRSGRSGRTCTASSRAAVTWLDRICPRATSRIGPRATSRARDVTARPAPSSPWRTPRCRARAAAPSARGSRRPPG